MAHLPISTWNYKSQPTSIRHIGPMAQDFYALFGVGEDDKIISTIDPPGIALAAIQELYRENETLNARVSELESLVQTLLAGRQDKAAGDYHFGSAR